jgi:2-oxoglutarate ferredoxin oxidoreductase subunit alpha
MAEKPYNSDVGKVVEIEEKEDVIIRFCGDSGDGMQLTGSRFTETTAIMGNDVSTLPDFPAEIRAPAGSLAGVSGYQIRFSSKDIRTPGDAPDVLVAMNPAALRTNLPDLKEGGMLIVNTDAFTQDNLDYAGYESNPIEDGTLDAYASYKINLTTLTQNALEESELTKKSKERCKNFFALGIMSWLYQRPMEPTLDWIEKKFKGKDDLIWANQKALKSGYYYSETAELFKKHYKIPKAELPKGNYRHITGNEATALGFVAAGQLAKKDLIYATYPITPASDILHELSKHKNFGVKTLQAEDEISAIGMAIGASFTGGLGLTGTSGPGLSLKAEALGLALMMELPLVVINVQRGGPSTGLPTKTEQSDLMQAMYGRHGESPVAIIAPATPGECFHLAIEAVRISTKYMTPVIFLSDGYLANGAEPWAIPDMSEFQPIEINHPKASEVHFYPYHRNPETLSRPWAIPGTPGLEHRLGGLEKQEETGNVSYDPLNHDAMIKVRAKKIAGIVQDVPDLEVYGDESGDILLLGWGSTHGAITSAVDKMREEGLSISSAHLRYLNPFPKNLEKVLSSFKTVIIPEMNQGQLVQLIRAKFLIDAIPVNKTQGKPFKITEITSAVKEISQKKNVA